MEDIAAIQQYHIQHIIDIYLNLKDILFIMIIFKVYSSILSFDETEKLWWKHGIFLFTWLNKGKYTCHYMSASQYKPVENTDVYVHITASWSQLIYIVCMFYVRMFLFVTSTMTPVYLEVIETFYTISGG